MNRLGAWKHRAQPHHRCIQHNIDFLYQESVEKLSSLLLHCDTYSLGLLSERHHSMDTSPYAFLPDPRENDKVSL